MLRHAANKDAKEESGQAYDVILVTENVKDLAAKQMAKLGVRVMRVGEFLDEAYGAQPAAATRAVCQAVKDLRNPPYTLGELLDVLRQAGAGTLVAGLSKDLGVRARPIRAGHFSRTMSRLSSVNVETHSGQWVSGESR